MEFSPAFKFMIETDKAGIIKINDVDPRIMEIALKHMYACKLGNLRDFDVRELLYVAHRYVITTLKDSCAKYAFKHITPENALFFLNLRTFMTQSMVAQDLENKLLQIIEDETEKCIAGEDNLRITEDTLIKLLKLNKLNLASELDLIKFVHRWAIAKIKHDENLEIVEDHKIRKVIEPKILSLINFVNLKQEEFYAVLCMTNWLNAEEKVEISHVIAYGKFSSKFPQYLSRNRVPRCICIKQTKIINPDTPAYNRPVFPTARPIRHVPIQINK